MLLLNLLLWGVTCVLALSPLDQHAYHDVARRSIADPAKASPIVTPSQQPNFTFPQLFNLQKKFLDNFIYPNNAEQAKAINSTLLAEDVLGRVDITRTFKGRELNTEYLFGLFANLAAAPGQISLLGVPLSYDILHFAANQNIVSASTKFVYIHSLSRTQSTDITGLYRFMFNFTALNLILPLRIDSWNTYNSAGEISQYDAIFVWWDWALTTVFQAAAPVFGANSTAAVEHKLQQALAESICATATKYCTGSNVQYLRASQCYDYLTTKVRFGQPWELGRNTLLCRMVHQNMVPYRPEVHCPHIGMTGGGYCTDNTDYAYTVNNDFFTNSPYVPYGH